MAKISLTDLGVQRLPQGVYLDAKMPAFGIRVGKNRKTWFISKGRERKVITLGHYPAVGLSEARRKAHGAFVAPEVAKASTTFPEALEAFLRQSRWRPSSKRVIESSLRHFKWKGQLARITHEQVIEALDAIEASSARAHALKDIRTLFNWCVPRYLPNSPAAGIRMESQPTRDRILTDDELKRVWIVARQCGQFGVIVRLLLLTGQRRSEIGGIKHEWIRANSITIPAPATKNGREHNFPLGVSSAILLSEMTKKQPPVSGYIFSVKTTTGEGSFSAWSKSHAALLKLSSTSGWTLHDLRRTFASNQARLGTPIHVIEKLLNHVSGSLSGVAGIYNRYSYFDEMRDAMQKYEDWLLSVVRET